MSAKSDFDRHAAAFLADGPTELADRVLDAALREVHMTHQRRRWLAPWRTQLMPTALRLGAAVVIVAVVGYVGLTLLKPPPAGPAAQASPSPTERPSPPRPSSPGVEPSPTVTPLDTSSWTIYASRWNWLAIRFPHNWTAVDADHAWTLARDAAWPNSATDHFISPDDPLEVSSWSVLVEPGTDLLSWIESYCPRNTAPCTGIADRAIPVVADPQRLHPGLLVAFDDSAQAFFLDGDRIYAVAVWRGESDPAVARWGGARRLLEAFALSMCFECAAPAGATFRPG